MAVEEVAGDEGVKGDDAPLGHPVEDFAGGIDLAEASVAIDEAVGGDDRGGAGRAEAERRKAHRSDGDV